MAYQGHQTPDLHHVIINVFTLSIQLSYPGELVKDTKPIVGIKRPERPGELVFQLLPGETQCALMLQVGGFPVAEISQV